MNNNYIYKYTYNNIPIYIGMGKNNRAYDHLNIVNYPKRKNIYFYNKLKKILDNNEEVNIEILHTNLSRKEAIEIEIYYIAFYGRKCLNLGTLYNLTKGGDGGCSGVISEETRIKRSISLTGKKRTPETKLKMSIVQTGIKRKKHTPEQIKYRTIQLQKARNNGGVKKFKETMKNRFIFSVNRIDKLGNIVFYNSHYDALKDVGGDVPNRIVRCCKKERKTYKGYKWEFVNNNKI